MKINKITLFIMAFVAILNNFNIKSEINVNHTRIVITQGDITKQSTEAIVNAANPELLAGNGF